MEPLKIGDNVTIKDLKYLKTLRYQFAGDLALLKGLPAKITGGPREEKISDFNTYKSVWTLEVCAPKDNDDVAAVLRVSPGACAKIELPAEFLSKVSGGRRRRHKTRKGGRKSRKTRRNLHRK